MSVQRYKLTLAYRGTAYHGWQEQVGYPETWKGDREAPGAPTIQYALRLAMQDVLRHPVTVVGSSRTDAGVHAKGQVAHFDTPMLQIPPEGMRRAINSRLPADIVVRAIEPVSATFNAISSTIEKRYQYVIWSALDRPPFFSDMVFHRWQILDAAAMQAAGRHLEGEHDFASFAKPGHGRESTVRTVYECSIASRGPRIVIGVRGSGFLWNMVRIIAGTLIDVGSGRTKPDAIPKILAARDRRAAGSTAPPHGLFLQWIRYGAWGLGSGARPEDAAGKSGHALSPKP